MGIYTKHSFTCPGCGKVLYKFTTANKAQYRKKYLGPERVRCRNCNRVVSTGFTTWNHLRPWYRFRTILGILLLTILGLAGCAGVIYMLTIIRPSSLNSLAPIAVCMMVAYAGFGLLTKEIRQFSEGQPGKVPRK